MSRITIVILSYKYEYSILKEYILFVIILLNFFIEFELIFIGVNTLGRYLIQRLLAIIPVFMIVAITVFMLIHITPGDPALLMAGDEATPAQIDALRKDLGLDKPIHIQLVNYFKDISRGNLGHSIFNNHDVRGLIVQRLEPTLSIAFVAEGLAILIGIPLGIIAAWKSNTLYDRLIMIFAVGGFAIPSFWLGYNLIWLFAVKLSWFPAIGYNSFTDGIGPWIQSITLPCISIGTIGAALIVRMTRSSMLEILREDYIRTARAKGLAEFPVLIRHAFKNAGLPVITVIGLGIAGLVTGLVVTEAVFAIPGVGRLMVNGVARRDFPIIQGVVLATTVSYVLINLLIDLSYGYLDPKIRYK